MTLRVKFVLVLLGISILTAIITSTAQLLFAHNQQLEQLDVQINALESTMLPSLVTSVWSLDQTQTEQLARSIHSLPYVDHIHITGNGIKAVSLGPTNHTAGVTSKTFSLTHSIDNHHQKIGTVTIYASLTPAYQVLSRHLWLLLVSNGLQIIFVALATLFLLSHYVINPINQLTRFFKKMPPLIDSKALKLSAPKSAWTELIVLQKRINQFRQELIDGEVKHNMQLRQLTALTHANPEVIWRCDFPTPIDTSNTLAQQAKIIFETGDLAELNNAAKRLLTPVQGLSPKNIKNLPFIQEGLINWMIKEDYRVKEVISHYQDRAGVKHYFRNSLACWIEKGRLFSIWGIAIDITQSLTTQKALERREQQLYLSQTRLSEAQALAHMGHWSYFVNGDKLQVSDEFARIYGLSPDNPNLNWSSISERIHPEDKSYVIHALSDPRNTAAGAEHRILWSNGEVRYVQSITRKNIVDGKLTSTFGILIDITDRRRAEDERSKSQRALAESEARLAQAQAIAHMGHWLLDSETKQLLCSDELYRLLGQTPQQQQLTQDAFLDCIHRDDQPLVKHLFNSAKEKSFTNEFRVIKANGEQRYMRGTFTSFYAGGISSDRVFGIMMDVTDQKQAELQLRASQELFATAFDSSPDGIFFVDSDTTNLIKVNQAFANMLAEDESQLLQQRFNQIPIYITPHNSRHIYEYIALQKSSTNVEIHITQHEKVINGLISWQHVIMAQKPCVLGIIHDVTPLRDLQKTAEEQQKQLIQADKLASIGTMVAGVAHEINNPNHLIQMNADLLEGFYQPIFDMLKKSNSTTVQFNNLSLQEIKEVIPELLSDIKKSSERINRIVKDLKDFARPQENSEYLPIDFNNVLEQTLHLLTSLIEKYPISIKIDMADNLPKILADSQRLEQVLVNLIMNAIEASPNQNSEITISTRLDRNLQQVECAITDQGYGIPEEQLPRIFDPFYTTKQAKGGTGLGLAISYRLIQEHRGTIIASRNSHKGITMRINLPTLELDA